MCILLTTNAHPEYPFILISNRDEYFERPTASAHFHHDNFILSPFDLARSERGTWIGVNKSGKLAVLVNYREESKIVGDISRGLIPMSFLESEMSSSEWEDSVLAKGAEFFDKIGGFSLLFGELGFKEPGKINPLGILSNRGDRGKVFADSEIPESVERDQHVNYFGLSNSLFSNPWPKVKMGEALLEDLVQASIAESYTKDELTEKLFDILSHDTFDPTKFAQDLRALRYSIFIPPTKVNNETLDDTSSATDKYYGTRTQTVIMMNKAGGISYTERDLDAENIAGTGQFVRSEKKFEFNLQLE